MRSLFSKVFLAHLLTLLIALVTVSLLLSSSFDRFYMKLAQRDLLTRATSMAERLAPFVGDPARQKEQESLTRLLEASSGMEVWVVLLKPGERQVGLSPSAALRFCVMRP